MSINNELKESQVKQEKEFKTYEIIYGIGLPKWFHMKDYYYQNKEKTVLIKVDPIRSTCFSTNFYAQVWIGKNKRTLVMIVEGKDDCLITLSTKSGLNGLTLFNWYKARMNLINANEHSYIRVNNEVLDRFSPAIKGSKIIDNKPKGKGKGKKVK